MKLAALFLCWFCAASAGAADPPKKKKPVVAKASKAKKPPAKPAKAAPKKVAPKPVVKELPPEEPLSEPPPVDAPVEAASQPTSAPVVEEAPPPPPTVAPWDMFAGGTPDKGHGIFQVEAGFTALPAVAYHFALTDKFTLGVRASFDYGFDQLDQVFQPSVLLQIPLRLALVRQRLSVGLRCDPGAGLTFAQVVSFGQQIASYSIVQVLVPISAAVEYHFGAFALGAGIDVSLRVAIPTTGTAISEAIPALAGPLFEAAVTDNVHLTVDAKAGVLAPIDGTPIFIFHAVAGMAVRL